METSTNKGRARAATIGIVAALGALVIATGTASAASSVGQSGTIGQYAVTDEQGDAVCSYDLSGGLDVISVVAPEIFARNKTNGVDQQQVGWRIVIKSKLAGTSTWTKLHKSSVGKANATDATMAALQPIKVEMPFPDDSSFSVIVKTFWYRGDGSVAGWAKTRIDAYTVHRPGLVDEYPDEACHSFGA